jgi:hypothetical protein
MKMSIAITLDGLVTALRYRGYAAAEEVEFQARRGKGAEPRDGWKATSKRSEVRGNEVDDVASN